MRERETKIQVCVKASWKPLTLVSTWRHVTRRLAGLLPLDCCRLAPSSGDTKLRQSRWRLASTRRPAGHVWVCRLDVSLLSGPPPESLSLVPAVVNPGLWILPAVACPPTMVLPSFSWVLLPEPFWL